MGKFKLHIEDLNNPDDSSQECYIVDLTYHQEAKPALYFQGEVRDEIQEAISKALRCEIKEPQLNIILEKWISEIREGYQNTTVRIALSPKGRSKMEEFAAFPPATLPTKLKEPDSRKIQPKITTLPPLDFIDP